MSFLALRKVYHIRRSRVYRQPCGRKGLFYIMGHGRRGKTVAGTMGTDPNAANLRPGRLHETALEV